MFQTIYTEQPFVMISTCKESLTDTTHSGAIKLSYEDTLRIKCNVQGGSLMNLNCDHDLDDK